MAAALGIRHQDILRIINKGEVKYKKGSFTNKMGRTYVMFVLSLEDAIKLSCSYLSSVKGNGFNVFLDEILVGRVVDEMGLLLALKLADIAREEREYDTYIVRDFRTGKRKIGRSTNIQARLADLQISSPNLLELELLITKDVEKELHDKYEEKRDNGEWFNINEKDVHMIHIRYTANAMYRDTLGSLLSELELEGKDLDFPEITDETSVKELISLREEAIKLLNY